MTGYVNGERSLVPMCSRNDDRLFITAVHQVCGRRPQSQPTLLAGRLTLIPNSPPLFGPSSFLLWVQPRCWPCLLFLTCCGSIFAASGAADITSATIMIGTGLVLDLARWTLHRRWLTQTYWIKQVEKALSDPTYVTKTRNLNRAWLISATAIFLLHGVLWVALAAPESRVGTSIFAQLHSEPYTILRISHMARSYAGELDGRGYPGRAYLWTEFVCQSFTIYIACILIWVFGWLRQMTVLNLVVRHRAISARVASLKPWPVSFAISSIFSIIGFLVINNLTTAHRVNQHVRSALPTLRRAD
jgi:hypothetical protein